MRIKWRSLWLAGGLVAASLSFPSGAPAADDAPVVHVKAVVKDGTVSLEAQADGPFEYTTYRPSANLLVLDLTGVADGDPAGARVVSSDLVKGYRVQSYSVANKPVVRVEVLLNHGAEPKIEKKDAKSLVLSLGAASDAAPVATSLPEAVQPPAKSDPAVAIPATPAPSASASLNSEAVNSVVATPAPSHQVSPVAASAAEVRPDVAHPAILPASVKTSDSKPALSSFEAIRKVNLQAKGSETDVNVVGSGPLKYEVTRLENPDRLVLDFKGSYLNTPEKHIPSTLEPVRQIRVAQFTPQVSRVVIDLRSPSDYQVNSNGSMVTVAFASAPARPAKMDLPAEDSSRLTTVKTQPTEAAKPEELLAKRAVIPIPSTSLPAAVTKSVGLARLVNAPVVASSTPAKLSYAAAAAPVSPVAPVTAAPMAPAARAPQSAVAPAASLRPVALTYAAPAAPVAPAPQPARVTAATTAAAPQQQAVSATQLAAAAAASSNLERASVTTPASASTEPAPGYPAAAAEQPVTSIAPRQVQAASSNGTRYTGEPISVNLKDVDLHDFFRLIHEISGLNVVVDPGVKGTLTIVLDDVPWDQALDIVLHNNDLDKQLDGNVLRIATKATLRKEAEENRDLAKAQAEAADVVTTTRVLSYAKASTMAATIKKFLSSRGDVLADDRSNSLIIRDIPDTMPMIDNLLRQLDRKSQQVEIESRIVSATRSFSREIGNTFALASRAGNSGVGGTSAVGTDATTFTPSPPIVVGAGGSSATGGQMPLLTSLGAVAPTSGVSYLFQSANFALDYVLDAAEAKGVGKLLSKPKVITQNNQKATVKQGTKIPVQTVVNNTVSVQFVDAVLELDVTPQITADGTIYMDVTVENDQIDQGIPRVQGIPAIDTQSAETKVTVVDGSTVVIGGIIVTQQNTAIQQVPLVGSVPILGNLFKHTTVTSSSQELLFFLTPRILPG